MKVKAIINYPKDMDALYDKASDVLADILIKKLQPNEIDKLVALLEDKNKEITW